jgi:hypothetical protein
MHWVTTLWRNRSGTAALEFALVAVPFLFVMLGIVDLGRYLLIQHSLDTLVNETARAMIVSCGNANYGKLTASCADPLSDDDRKAIAPFLYRGGHAPTHSASCGSKLPCPTTGQFTITASMSSLNFLLPILPADTKLTQTTTLYY